MKTHPAQFMIFSRLSKLRIHFFARVSSVRTWNEVVLYDKECGWKKQGEKNILDFGLRIEKTSCSSRSSFTGPFISTQYKKKASQGREASHSCFTGVCQICAMFWHKLAQIGTNQT